MHYVVSILFFSLLYSIDPMIIHKSLYDKFFTIKYQTEPRSCERFPSLGLMKNFRLCECVHRSTHIFPREHLQMTSNIGRLEWLELNDWTLVDLPRGPFDFVMLN